MSPLGTAVNFVDSYQLNLSSGKKGERYLEEADTQRFLQLVHDSLTFCQFFRGHVEQTEGGLARGYGILYPPYLESYFVFQKTSPTSSLEVLWFRVAASIPNAFNWVNWSSTNEISGLTTNVNPKNRQISQIISLTFRQNSRQLIAKTLPASCTQNHDGILSRHYSIDSRFLKRSEGFKFEGLKPTKWVEKGGTNIFEDELRFCRPAIIIVVPLILCPSSLAILIF